MTSSRTPDQVAEAAREMRPFHRAGYELIPIAAGSKVPVESGWRSANYSRWGWKAWLAAGGNAAIRLRATDAVVDVDPRHGGVDSLFELLMEHGADLLDDAPHVLTGGGGDHYFFAKPADLRIRGKVPGFQGIDVKTAGGYVLAAGSIHPNGMPYLLAPDSPPPGAALPLPPAILELLTDSHGGLAERTAEPGALEPEQVAMLLGVLDARKFAAYEDWIRVSAAAHDASGGHALEQWMQWCWSDPDFSTVSPEVLTAKWDSFRAGRERGVTVRTLYQEVAKAGRIDLLKHIAAVEDFRDEMDAAPIEDIRRPRD